MLRLLLLVALLSCLGTPAAADQIDDYIERRMRVSHIPGAAIAVVENGRVRRVGHYGVANVEWNAPVDRRTAFQLASATKLFTGVLVMRLVEQRRLSLDAPIASFFEGAPESWSRITLRQLANHSSGLSDSLGQPRPATVPDTVTAAMRTPLAYEPGTETRYGFTDFIILRAILERVSGLGFEALLEREIVRPLGLTATGFADMREDGGNRSYRPLPRRASTYAWSNGVQRGSDFIYREHGHSAGGIYSSIADLAAFFAAIDNGRLLRPESVAQLETAASLPGGRRGGFGIGWSVRRYRGVDVVGHSGGPALADIVRIPSRRLTIIALINQQNFYPLLAEGIADFYLPRPPEPAGIADASPADAQRLRALLASAAAGTLDPQSFTEAGRAGATGFLQGFGRALLQAVGPVRSLRLLQDSEANGLRTRRYRIQFEERPIEWLFVTDANGLVQALHPVGES